MNVSEKKARTINKLQDLGRLSEIDGHSLIRLDDPMLGEETTQNISFDQVKRLGAWFLQQKFDLAVPSKDPLPVFFRNYNPSVQGPLLAKIAYGPQAEKQFPVTVEFVTDPDRPEYSRLLLHHVGISLADLARSEHESVTDSMLALASAAAFAPFAILPLRDGVQTTRCSTKKTETPTGMRLDHGSPLAVVFETVTSDAEDSKTASRTSSTLSAIEDAKQNKLLTLRDLGHVHGQDVNKTALITTAAGKSKMAAGVSIRSVYRDQLQKSGKEGKHILFFQQGVNEFGQPRLVGLYEALADVGIKPSEVGVAAVALGFTTHIVGNSVAEKKVEKIFDPSNAEVPMSELIR